MVPDTSGFLWRLRGHGRDVRCERLRTSGGHELRVLWGQELFLTETFRDPRQLEVRAEEFRATLLSRGWVPMAGGGDDAPADEPPVTPAAGVPRAWATPVEGATADQSMPAVPAGPDKRRRTVLIVDDEESIRHFLRAYLREAGYDTVEAADVDSALDALDSSSVDAVVLDVRMPDPMGWGRTGLEVLAFLRLHAAFARLPVLILTGYPPEPEERDLIERHGAHLFLKPDGHRQLLRRLEALTGGGLPRH